MAKAVRLADIGERLGVSTVTVSKALSGQKGVSEELRRRIIRLAKEMGYVKSMPEDKQEVKTSYTIGVVVAERYLQENQSFYWILYQEISKRAIGKNCFPMLEVISREAEDNREFPKVITEKKVDGLLILGAFSMEYVNHLFSDTGLPMLNLDTTNGWERCDCVVSNNLMGGYRMTNYLFELGHKRIGFVGTRIIDDRSLDDGKIDRTKFVLPKDMPTAFFCNCDLSAALLITKLEDSGYRVPEDVSVVGFDNYVSDQFAGIGLTTYEIDTKEMADRAVHIIIHKCRNAAYTSGIFMLAGKFIERTSAKRVDQPVPFV